MEQSSHGNGHPYEWLCLLKYNTVLALLGQEFMHELNYLGRTPAKDLPVEVFLAKMYE